MSKAVELDTDTRKLLAQAKRAQARVVTVQGQLATALDNRRASVLALHDAGLSRYRIAQELGLSHTAVGNVVNGRSD